MLSPRYGVSVSARELSMPHECNPIARTLKLRLLRLLILPLLCLMLCRRAVAHFASEKSNSSAGLYSISIIHRHHSVHSWWARFAPRKRKQSKKAHLIPVRVWVWVSSQRTQNKHWPNTPLPVRECAFEERVHCLSSAQWEKGRAREKVTSRVASRAIVSAFQYYH